MTPSGGIFVAGALNMASIPFTQLRSKQWNIWNTCTYGIEGVRLGIHPLVSAWVRGHKICHPPVKLRTPHWDLQAILVALGGGTF